MAGSAEDEVAKTSNNVMVPEEHWWLKPKTASTQSIQNNGSGDSNKNNSTAHDTVGRNQLSAKFQPRFVPSSVARNRNLQHTGLGSRSNIVNAVSATPATAERQVSPVKFTQVDPQIADHTQIQAPAGNVAFRDSLINTTYDFTESYEVERPKRGGTGKKRGAEAIDSYSYGYPNKKVVRASDLYTIDKPIRYESMKTNGLYRRANSEVKKLFQKPTSAATAGYTNQNNLPETPSNPILGSASLSREDLMRLTHPKVPADDAWNSPFPDIAMPAPTPAFTSAVMRGQTMSVAPSIRQLPESNLPKDNFAMSRLLEGLERENIENEGSTDLESRLGSDPNPLKRRPMPMGLKIMEKYGFKKGQSLGKDGSGIKKALRVVKGKGKGPRSTAKIVGPNRSNNQIEPTLVSSNITNVALLERMVDGIDNLQGGLDDGTFTQKIGDEFAAKYGDIEHIHIEAKRADSSKSSAVFVKFRGPEAAARAIDALQGYKYDDINEIQASFYPADKYDAAAYEW